MPSIFINKYSKIKLSGLFYLLVLFISNLIFIQTHPNQMATTILSNKSCWSHKALHYAWKV